MKSSVSLGHLLLKSIFIIERYVNNLNQTIDQTISQNKQITLTLNVNGTGSY